MRKEKFWKIVLSLIALIVIVFLWRHSSVCGVKREKVTIRGASLSGLLEHGDEVTVKPDYYTCNPVERGDVVLLHVGLGDERLIKIIKAVPGDTWGLQHQSDNTYTVLVNGQELRTTAGKLYRMSGKRVEMLRLYINDYHGIIPERAYLVFGNQEFGSVDSSTFGLISLGDIQGKVMVP